MNVNRKVGFYAAILSVIFTIFYCIPQILSTSKLLVYPHDLFWLFLPSLFLGSTFLVTMISLHYSRVENLKLWTAIGIAFAVIYCTLTGTVYFVQLTVVIPAQLNGSLDNNHLLIFKPKTFLMAVDCLGYFFMSLSTLFSAFAFKNQEEYKWLYRGLLYNGLLIPVLILAFFFPFFYYIGALWMITFPVAMIKAAQLFRRETYGST